MMNKKISSREFNKKVRELFIKEVDKSTARAGKEVVRWNCNRYNNELCNGYKIVWKSFGWYGFEKVWRNILKEVNKIDKGWKLVESSSYMGDGNVWGMSKEYRNLELKKK